MKRRKTKKESPEASDWGWRTITISALLLILVAVAGLLVVRYRKGNYLNPPEYQGKIVDKWVGYHTTETGSFPYFRLVLEPQAGFKTTVAVDRQTFERAQVGMWIVKSRKGIEFFSTQPTSTHQRGAKVETALLNPIRLG